MDSTDSSGDVVRLSGRVESVVECGAGEAGVEEVEDTDGDRMDSLDTDVVVVECTAMDGDNDDDGASG